jgi:hypothetical protein
MLTKQYGTDFCIDNEITDTELQEGGGAWREEDKSRHQQKEEDDTKHDGDVENAAVILMDNSFVSVPHYYARCTDICDKAIHFGCSHSDILTLVNTGPICAHFHASSDPKKIRDSLHYTSSHMGGRGPICMYQVIL